VRRAGLLFLTGALAITLLAGCGSGKPPTSAQLALERADLIAVVHGLQGLEGQLKGAARKTRAAWPYVVNGPSGGELRLGGAEVAQAAASAAAISVPAVLGEAQSAELTGPGSPIAGVFRTFIGLVPVGWKLIDASLAEIQRGPPVAARFARETVALYIESVYDGFFSLGQIGKKVGDGFKALGAEREFGASLTAAEVKALEGAYSEASFRLQPHAGVKLGS
jgi:hypothetical protein